MLDKLQRPDGSIAQGRLCKSLARSIASAFGEGVLPQAYEDQASLVRVAQAQVEACEDELASQAAELEALQVGCSCRG